MYRLIIESLLGLRLDVDKLYFAPCIPSTWDGFKLHYRYRETVYHIAIARAVDGNMEASVTLDGVRQNGTFVRLVDDHKEHVVELYTEESNPLGLPRRDLDDFRITIDHI